jgi:hypothetical protein
MFFHDPRAFDFRKRPASLIKIHDSLVLFFFMRAITSVAQLNFRR